MKRIFPNLILTKTKEFSNLVIRSFANEPKKESQSNRRSWLMDDDFKSRMNLLKTNKEETPSDFVNIDKTQIRKKKKLKKQADLQKKQSSLENKTKVLQKLTNTQTEQIGRNSNDDLFIYNNLSKGIGKEELGPQNSLLKRKTGSENIDISDENFIRWMEMNLMPGDRELVYILIHFYKTKNELEAAQLSQKKCLNLRLKLLEKIKKILAKENSNSAFLPKIDNLDFLNFPDLPELLKIRNNIKEEVMDSGLAKVKYDDFLRNQEVTNSLLKKEKKEYFETGKNEQKEEKEELKIRIYDNFQNEAGQHFMQEEKLLISKWIYIYGLPYEFDSTRIFDEFKKMNNVFGEIEQMQFVKYKNFIEKIDYEKLVYQQSQNAKKDNFMKSVIKSKPETGLPKITVENSETTQKIIRSPSTIGKNTLFQRILNQRSKEFDKSYMLLKFKNHETKRVFLDDNLRVFGLTICDFTFRSENADLKRTLKLINFPVSMTTGELFGEINKALQENQIPCFSLENVNANKVLDFRSIYLTFSDFEMSLKALNVLNDLQVKGRCLKAFHNYGGAHFIEGDYKELQVSMFKNIIKEWVVKNLEETKEKQIYGNFGMENPRGKEFEKTEMGVSLNSLIYT